MAGQGVEYGWGKAKQYFRRHNTMDNNTFKKRVIECIDTSEVLTMERVRKFARRARAYRNGYKDPELAGSYLGIERLVKRSKGASLNFGSGVFVHHERLIMRRQAYVA